MNLLIRYLEGMKELKLEVLVVMELDIAAKELDFLRNLILEEPMVLDNITAKELSIVVGIKEPNTEAILTANTEEQQAYNMSIVQLPVIAQTQAERKEGLQRKEVDGHELPSYPLLELTYQHKDYTQDAKESLCFFFPLLSKHCSRSQISHQYSCFSSQLLLLSHRLFMQVTVLQESHGIRDE